MSACLALVNTWSRSGDHINSFFVLSSGRIGASWLASVAVHAESWFVWPKKAWRSVRFAVVGKLQIASVIDLSMQ